MKTIKLYSTIACHLCEQAEALIDNVGIPENYVLVKRDILDNQQWLEKYRVLIPVIEFDGNELLWPFNEKQLKTFFVLHCAI